MPPYPSFLCPNPIKTGFVRALGLAQVCNLLCPENIGGAHHVFPIAIGMTEPQRKLVFSWRKAISSKSSRIWQVCNFAVPREYRCAYHVGSLPTAESRAGGPLFPAACSLKRVIPIPRPL